MNMMKKTLFVLTLMATVGAVGPVASMAQTTAAATQQDTVAAVDPAAGLDVDDELEAFSDTTQTDTADAVAVGYGTGNSQFPFDDEEFSVGDFLGGLDMTALAGMGFALVALVILFLLAPLLIIALVLYFVYKNRKQRMRLAEMAMQNGQPIPQELVGEPRTTDDDLRAKGIRQAALGIGLACFLGWTIGDIGAGIGVLVLCIGLGNLIIARQRKKQDW